MVGYNSKTFGRKMRLMNIIQSAGKLRGSDATNLQKKLAGLSDSEGDLTIVWAELPDRNELDAFSEAWKHLGENEDSVTHVWLGMPDKPLKVSAKSDHIAIRALCKKISDSYFQEYLLEIKKVTANPINPADSKVKLSNGLYEPEWTPLQKESSRLINDNA